MAQETIVLDEVSSVTDQELITRLRQLVRADRRVNARLIVHLGEVDARGLYREHAYPSMFAYCVEELHMSEAEAYAFTRRGWVGGFRWSCSCSGRGH
jgi:hypothetical protein